jgi:hypothetical protein
MQIAAEKPSTIRTVYTQQYITANIAVFVQRAILPDFIVSSLRFPPIWRARFQYLFPPGTG